MSILFLVYTLAILVIAGAICAYLGTKRGMFNSALRLGFFLISGILAFIITRLLSPVVGNALVDVLGSNLGEEFIVLLENQALRNMVKKVIGGIVSPIVFLPLFFVIDKLSFFAYVPLRKKLADREQMHNIPHDKVYGAILGVVLSLCITLSCVMPIGGYPKLLAETMDQIGGTALTEELFPQEMIADVNEIANYGIVKTDYAISGWLFNGLSADTRTFVAEAANLIKAADHLVSEQNPADAVEALQQVSPQSIATFAAIFKDSLAQIIDDDDSSVSDIAALFLDGLQALPELEKTLGKEEYNKELERISTLVTALQNKDVSDPQGLLKAALSSKVMQTIIVSGSDLVAEKLSEVTSSLTKKQKRELKAEMQEYLEESEVEKDVVDALFNMLDLD